MKTGPRDREPVPAQPFETMFDAILLVVLVLATLSIRPEPVPGPERDPAGVVHAASPASVEPPMAFPVARVERAGQAAVQPPPPQADRDRHLRKPSCQVGVVGPLTG